MFRLNKRMTPFDAHLSTALVSAGESATLRVHGGIEQLKMAADVAWEQRI